MCLFPFWFPQPHTFSIELLLLKRLIRQPFLINSLFSHYERFEWLHSFHASWENTHSLGLCFLQHSKDIFYKSNSANNSQSKLFWNCVASRVKRSNFNIFSYLDKTHSNFKVTVLLFGSSHLFFLCLVFLFLLPYRSTLLPFWESNSSEFYRVLSTKKESDLINCSLIIL